MKTITDLLDESIEVLHSSTMLIVELYALAKQLTKEKEELKAKLNEWEILHLRKEQDGRS